MFSKSIIGSAKFIRMPATSRLLYYDLGMQADDDGIVEAFSVMRLTGATEDDLRVLVAKQFVTVLNDELVTLINDWSRNNFIRQDRYRPSIYRDLVVKLDACSSGTQVEPSWNPVGIPSDTQLVDQWSPQVRLGKVSIGQVSIGEEEEPPELPEPPEPEEGTKKENKVRHKYGQYANVLLTDEDLEKLKNEFPDDWKDRIERLSEYMASTGKSYKSHLATIRNWARRDAEKRKKESAAPDYGDPEDFYK